ncbi:hypothetical protein EVAR_94300_1 [Eumeta japonica]|uniref:Uncharacterized protein n=1 Tax=Eumeta variegata TaxID=151549 RepID=A0A4C1UF19_EUMVA|nr:hypothetical protein EVAR_94300_1 [Eumeta japonica]
MSFTNDEGKCHEQTNTPRRARSFCSISSVKVEDSRLFVAERGRCVYVAISPYEKCRRPKPVALSSGPAMAGRERLTSIGERA